jgi:hypothetical protein
MASREDELAMLTAMGFESAQVRQAFATTGGTLEQVANYLLSGAAAPPAVVAYGAVDDGQDASPVRMVHSSMSQYTVAQGKSACTCISLTAAEKFLQRIPAVAATTTTTPVTSAFLEEIVSSGVAAYQRLQTSAGLAVEHLSAEEVLNEGGFPSLALQGGIRQGVLSNSGSNPQGLRQQLLDCQSPNSWTCVLITKTPETVLVCLPANNRSDSGGDSSFYLLDSHPRPQEFNAAGSYARIHNSIDALASSLSSIFPVTELGSDIPEMMTIMYNSFDLYPLQLASSS